MHILEHVIEVKRLALLALQLTNATRCPEVGLEKGLPGGSAKGVAAGGTNRRVRQQKDAERNAYWDTPEGKAEREARWAEVKARYEK